MNDIPLRATSPATNIRIDRLNVREGSFGREKVTAEQLILSHAPKSESVVAHLGPGAEWTRSVSPADPAVRTTMNSLLEGLTTAKRLNYEVSSHDRQPHVTYVHADGDGRGARSYAIPDLDASPSLQAALRGAGELRTAIETRSINSKPAASPHELRLTSDQKRDYTLFQG